MHGDVCSGNVLISRKTDMQQYSQEMTIMLVVEIKRALLRLIMLLYDECHMDYALKKCRGRVQHLAKKFKIRSPMDTIKWNSPRPF